MSPFYRFAARGAIIPFLKAVSRQKVTGTENIPREGGFITVANHLTDLDSLTAIQAMIWRRHRKMSMAPSQGNVHSFCPEYGILICNNFMIKDLEPLLKFRCWLSLSSFLQALSWKKSGLLHVL